MTPQWVDEAWSRSAVSCVKASDPDLVGRTKILIGVAHILQMKLRLPCFFGCTICLTGLGVEERKNIQDELQRMTSIVKSFTAHIGQLLAGLQQ